jgi:hypothetical protein
VRRDFIRQCFRKSGHRRTKTVRKHQSVYWLLHRNRGDVDDPPLSTLFHPRQYGAHEIDDAHQREIDSFRPHRARERLEFPARRPARVRHEDVDLPETRHRCRDRCLNVRGIGDITRHRQNLAPGLPAYPYRDLRWSADGTRLLAARRDGNIVELDVATGKTLRTFDVGSANRNGLTYAGDEILVGRATSAGDIWQADLR